MKLYIDDLRDPINEELIVLRSYAEAVGWMRKNGCPTFISFDHDLGSNDGLDGIDIIKWMINMDLNTNGTFIPSNFTFHIHSANIIGAENMKILLNNYLELKEGNNNDKKNNILVNRTS